MPEPTSAPPRRPLLACTALAFAASLCGTTASLAATPQSPAATASAPQRSAADEVALQQGFARWVKGFRASARAAGITEATLRSAFEAVQYLPRVIELDRAQPEFERTVWDYLDTAVSPQRVARGQEKLLQVREAADAAAERYGVAPGIMVAIWGIESRYGDIVGSTPTIDALATLGFEGRRRDWARAELLATLKIVQSGDIARAQMIGSWAGAMGQTQFLPSSFLAYAVDADGDGRRDIWGSVADVLASTANYLARAGWRAGEPWGAEVQLPPGFDVSRAAVSVRKPTAQWVAEGVRSIDDAALPKYADGAILLPAGARGPAFLVGPNFRAILRYNNSTSYALAVGLLAQGIGNGPGVRAPWPRDLAALTRSQVQALQAALNQRGFGGPRPDGRFGPATREALRRYQRSVGLPADGYPTVELLLRLQQQ
jgi:lytic murein transglycosylase